MKKFNQKEFFGRYIRYKQQTAVVEEKDKAMFNQCEMSIANFLPPESIAARWEIKRTNIEIIYTTFGAPVLGEGTIRYVQVNTFSDDSERITHHSEVHGAVDFDLNVIEREAPTYHEYDTVDLGMEHIRDLKSRTTLNISYSSHRAWSKKHIAAGQKLTIPVRTKSPSEYTGEAICPRCASGYEICVDGHDHSVCRNYVWDYTPCRACQKKTGFEFDDYRSPWEWKLRDIIEMYDKYCDGMSVEIHEIEANKSSVRILVDVLATDEEAVVDAGWIVNDVNNYLNEKLDGVPAEVSINIIK